LTQSYWRHRRNEAWEGDSVVADPFIGQIIAVGFNYAPENWLPCDGRLVPISEFEPLFQLIGTTYGGDGQSTFGLPNLNGRVPLGVGKGPRTSDHVLGEMGGNENVTLQQGQVGSHAHPLLAAARMGTTNTPGPGVALAENAQPAAFLYAPQAPNVALSPSAITASGGSTPHENRQPYQVINYIICANGIFPSPG